MNESIEAEAAVRRVLFLDRTLAVAHYLLGTILRRRGAFDEAQRAFRNARNLCGDRPAEEPVRFSEGEPAGRLARCADLQCRSLDVGGDGG